MKVYMDKAGKIVPELSFTPVEQTSRNPGEKKQKKIVSEGQTKATVLGPLDMIPSRTMKDTPQYVPDHYSSNRTGIRLLSQNLLR